MAGQEQPTVGSDSEEFIDECPLPRTGEVLGARYRIESRLGRGGMGVVFRAAHAALGCSYAVKFVRRELAGKARAVERFQREAQLLAGLRHDNITQVFDVGWYRERTPFIVMELLEGHTLRAELDERGPLELGRALHVMRQACLAMAYAHEQGVIHRDLKPENLMLTRASEGSERVKLLDFGIAQCLGPIDTRLTPTGATLGTCHYMSPEQARGETALTAASDVYSLGVIFYELLSGRRPHSGDSHAAVLFQLLTRPPAPLQRYLPSCPGPILTVVNNCLRGQPEERYPSAAELLRALEAHIPSPARGVGDSSKTTGHPSERRRLINGLALAALVVPGLTAAAVFAPTRAERKLDALEVSCEPARGAISLGSTPSLPPPSPPGDAARQSVSPAVDPSLPIPPSSPGAAKRKVDVNPGSSRAGAHGELAPNKRIRARVEPGPQALSEGNVPVSLPFVSRNPYD